MSRTIAERARRAVIAVLPRAVTVPTIQGDAGVNLLVNGAPVQVRWVGGGELRHVRALLAKGSEQPDVVAARHQSTGARAALTNAGVGWVDETGAAEVALPQLVISRSGRPPPKAERESRWNPSVLAVAEALLCGTTATVSATTEATGLSAAGCANALRTLTNLGLPSSCPTAGRCGGG